MSITTRDQLLTLALRTARVVPAGQAPRAPDIALAADYLNLELGSLQARSNITRTVPRVSFTLTSGTASYALPATAIDVKVGPNGEVGTVKNTSGVESQVFEMSQAEYQSISDKTSSGLPTRAYVEKLAAITVYLWPVPDITCTSLQYMQVRAITESDTGAATVDLQRKWWRAVMLAVAAEVARAKSQPLDFVASLRGDAERLYEVLRASDVQHGPIRCVVTHRVNRWS